MWYFTWILGLGLALAFGIINVMWLEANYAFGVRDEAQTRERFERQKLVAGLLKACEKRPVSIASIEGVADKVEATLQERPEKEMATEEVGALVMDELKRLDKVAYVRFASVYRHFRDISEFMTELKDLLNAKE